MLYTCDLVANMLKNWEHIQSFLERTTQELFPTFYDYPDSDYYNQEGNTLQDRGPHNTRVPKRDQLKENLIVMKADISNAIEKLDKGEQIEVLYHYQISQAEEKPYSAIILLQKLVNTLNGLMDNQL